MELTECAYIVKVQSSCYAVWLFFMRTTFENHSNQNWPDMWQAAYRMLEEHIVPSMLTAWIQPLQWLEPEKTDKGLRIRFMAPNDFSVNWVRDHYKEIIETIFGQITGLSCELQMIVDPNAPARTQEPVSEPHESPAEGVVLKAERVDLNRPKAPFAAGVSVSPEHSLDTRYRFENFVVGASNQFAHASAVAVAEQPGRQYNPLFIYSPPGLGKTHLLYAIGNHVLAKNPKARVTYLSAENFVNELIDCLQHRRMSQFRTKYRDSYDLILIDDIQFIAGKNTSEEEFFHTFNALHSSKRQIVVTSDRLPKDIEKLEERIRTRFEWGLVVDISPPEIETRIAILKTKAEREDIYLPDDVATFLASYIKSNVRELEGVLIRLQAQASLTGAEISLEMAKHELKAAVPEEGSSYTAESIQQAVARHFQLKVQDLKSTTRARHVALPRQIGMYLIRKYTSLGFREIGHFFGGKDHTTILHACSKIEKGLESDDEIRQSVESIQNLL